MGSHGSTGRDFARRHQRVPCDLLAAGRVYKGFATALAPHQMFVQLAGGSLPRRGADVVIRLRDLEGDDSLEIEAIVTHQQLTEVEDRGISRGVEVRINGAPPEYHSIFADPAMGGDTTKVELLIEVDIADPDLPAQRDFRAPAPGIDHAEARHPVDEEPTTDEDLPIAPDPAVDLPVERPSRDGATEPASRSGDAVPTGRAPDPVESTLRSPIHAAAGMRASDVVVNPHPLRAANAIVVYDGDRLNDIYQLLEELGAKPERARLSGPTRFRGWELPPRLLVVDAQDALSIDWPQNPIADGVMRVAVASTASAVIGKILRGQGFHYLIRRPVHPRALELLFRLALHRGPERRKQVRSTLGIDARLVTSPWRWAASCTLLELSPMGCRVVTRQDVPLLDRITLRTSRAVTGSRPLSLNGRVVRRVHDDATGEWSLAIRFLDVPPAQYGRLDDLLARTAVGPTSTLVESPPARLRLWLRGLFASRSPRASAAFANPVALGVGDEPPSVVFEPERRHGIRGLLDSEVVALDESRRRVTAVLAGRDLSTLGMRVDPHPEFVMGRRMLVAFYDSVSRGTLEISAEVVRDDGPRGIGIRFVGMDTDTAARLEQLVAALPAVESLTDQPRGLMVAHIRADESSLVPSLPPDLRPPAESAASESAFGPDDAAGAEDLDTAQSAETPVRPVAARVDREPGRPESDVTQPPEPGVPSRRAETDAPADDAEPRSGRGRRGRRRRRRGR